MTDQTNGRAGRKGKSSNADQRGPIPTIGTDTGSDADAAQTASTDTGQDTQTTNAAPSDPPPTPDKQTPTGPSTDGDETSNQRPKSPPVTSVDAAAPQPLTRDEAEAAGVNVELYYPNG